MAEIVTNRALHPDDYNTLVPYPLEVERFERMLRERSIPFRKDHAHRTWEYANVLRQLDQFGPRVDFARAPVVLDTGAGGSSLAPMLVMKGYHVVVTDAMTYGDIIEPFLVPQCHALNIVMPVVTEPVEAMPFVASNSVDITMCISVIEHVDASAFEQGLRELWRVTAPGGLLFITSDFFRDDAQWEASPYRGIQHTRFTPELAVRIPEIIDVEFVGGHDFTYRGDFVHNYSFVNFCLRKPLQDLT